MRDNLLLNDKYRIVKKLKESQERSVYLCKNIQTEKPCIIKKYRKDRSSELEILKKLSHESLPKISEWFETLNYEYIVENYFDGHTLKQLLKEKGAFKEEEAIGRIYQLCEVLKYVHNEGVVHGDIKPSNIILAGDGTLKLVDFGAAQYPGQNALCFGTIGYAAPENFGFTQIDERADIFSMGAVLYHMLSGKENNKPIFIITEDCHISKSLIRVIRKCTAYNKDLRYQSIELLMSSFQNM